MFLILGGFFLKRKTKKNTHTQIKKKISNLVIDDALLSEMHADEEKEVMFFFSNTQFVFAVPESLKEKKFEKEKFVENGILSGFH